MDRYAPVGSEDDDDLVWEERENGGKRGGRVEAFRVACEIVLVLAVILLSLRIATQHPGWPRGANEPSKQCKTCYIVSSLMCL